MGSKFLLPLKRPKSLSKYYSSNESRKLLLAKRSPLFLSSLYSKMFTSLVQNFRVKDEYIIRCRPFQYEHIYLLISLYLKRRRANQIRFKTRKNTIWYFKRSHLITHEYFENASCLFVYFSYFSLSCINLTIITVKTVHTCPPLPNLKILIETFEVDR